MFKVFLIAKNTLKEMLRDRILYGLIFFSTLTLGFSLVLGELSFSEQKKISVDFSLATIHLSVVFLSIFSGASLVFREIEKKTVFTLLSLPVSREVFLVGKVMGFLLLLLLFFTGFVAIFSLVLLGIEQEWSWKIVLVLAGIFIESVILLLLSIFWGTLVRPTLSVIVTFSIFLLGHWLDNLHFFAEKTENEWVRWADVFAGFFLPHLERLNWKNDVFLVERVNWENVFLSTGYGFCYALFVMGLLLVIMRRKDFE